MSVVGELLSFSFDSTKSGKDSRRKFVVLLPAGCDTSALTTFQKSVLTPLLPSGPK